MISLIIYMIYPKKEDDTLNYSHGSASILPTEQFIKDFLIASDGTIRTNFAQKENEEGKHRLSESIGLWLEYLVVKDDMEGFQNSARVVEEYFLLHENIVAWEIKDDKQATTNALIDDLRIIEALFLEGEKSNNSVLIRLAKEISEAILQYNKPGDYFVDFHDTKFNYSNENLTLSYLNPEPFRYMVSYGLLSEDSLKELLDFMKEIPSENGFYPKTFDTVEQLFIYDDTINLIDQLYTAIYLEKAGVDTGEFYEWLKATFYKQGFLYGRYNRITKEPAVDYEAASVYALTIIYSVGKNDDTFSLDVYEQMKNMQVRNKDHMYYGGYVDLSTSNTHSFDNLLPLIAERILHLEKIIN